MQDTASIMDRGDEQHGTNPRKKTPLQTKQSMEHADTIIHSAKESEDTSKSMERQHNNSRILKILRTINLYIQQATTKHKTSISSVSIDTYSILIFQMA